MTAPAETPPPVAPAQLTLVAGSTFCISDARGDVGSAGPDGLFIRDVRALATWVLTFDGRPGRPLATHREGPFAATVLCQPERRPGEAESPLLAVRRRFVGGGMREEITLRNDGARDVTCVLRLRVGTDLAGIFEVKAETDVAHAHATASSPSPAEVRLTGRRHAVHVVADRAGADPSGFRWPVEVPARSTWSVAVDVSLAVDGVPLPVRHRPAQLAEHRDAVQRLAAARSSGPVVETGNRSLALLLRRSVDDLAALRIHDPQHPQRPVVAAGAPWFMALFGRDSLLTSWMVLPIDTELALGTLQTLAERQGSRVDPVADEEPGKILHEVRFGSGTPFGNVPVYYGTVDATALFVMLVAEVRRWRGDVPEVAALLPHVDRALEWLTGHTERGSGFVTYRRASPSGLLHQGWKDSGDGVSFADGRPPDGPIALAEVQGYTYAAYRDRARWAADLGDEAAAREWDRRADRLQAAFDEQFWLPERQCYALALDGHGRPVDAVASNMGHCLWAGIVPRHRAAAVADRLLSEELFSGWGVRTLATTMAAYNPLSYHNGSVWPHDTALCVAGLARYGFTDAAQRLGSALLQAAARSDDRLVELFAGFPRDAFPAPVPYPASCSPQAWAAAAPLLVLRAFLGFAPDVPAGRVAVDPAVPPELLPLRVDGVQVGAARACIEVGPDGWRVTGLADSGLALLCGP